MPPKIVYIAPLLAKGVVSTRSPLLIAAFSTKSPMFKPLPCAHRPCDVESGSIYMNIPDFQLEILSRGVFKSETADEHTGVPSPDSNGQTVRYDGTFPDRRQILLRASPCGGFLIRYSCQEICGHPLVTQCPVTGRFMPVFTLPGLLWILHGNNRTHTSQAERLYHTRQPGGYYRQSTSR